MKNLFIAEKPSVATEFAAALGMGAKKNGYIESPTYVISWCVGHLVTMSYPEVYDKKYKRWDLDTLPFIPEEYKYEIIPGVKKQFDILKTLMHREDIGCIYICTDSGREGEYIYRLVDMMIRPVGKQRKRVWIDSQTKEEILRGIQEAKDWSEYDNLCASAFLRAKEDYLMGINFSRLITLKYQNVVGYLLKKERVVMSVGRVMTCVLGMVVRKEREIRNFVKTPFYRVIGKFAKDGLVFDAEWKAVEGSRYVQSPLLYKENGFKERVDAERLIAQIKDEISGVDPLANAIVEKLEKKKEIKHPPQLYNLAELQNDCSKRFKISPNETLKIAQELYEKKLITYPRTDARVLSKAVAKEISKHLKGLRGLASYTAYVDTIFEQGREKIIGKTKYVNDTQITDHYAIIPTGEGLFALPRLQRRAAQVYDLIVRRFLSVFYPPAVYEKYQAIVLCAKERFFAGLKTCKDSGYLVVANPNATSEEKISNELVESEVIKELKKNMVLAFQDAYVKEGETSPPKRYTSGSMILAMENAGQFIEDEDLRSQIKGSGIGTSATRAEILNKLVTIGYLSQNKRTQVITPTILGECVFEAVNVSIKQLLNPDLTASWERGLTYVAEGSITSQEYIKKLNDFVRKRTESVIALNNQHLIREAFTQFQMFYT